MTSKRKGWKQTVTSDTVWQRHSGVATQAKRKTEIIIAPILFANKESSGADKANVGKSRGISVAAAKQFACGESVVGQITGTPVGSEVFTEDGM